MKHTISTVTDTMAAHNKKVKLGVEALTSPSRENAALALSSLCFLSNSNNNNNTSNNNKASSPAAATADTSNYSDDNPHQQTLNDDITAVSAAGTPRTAASSYVASSAASNLMSSMLVSSSATSELVEEEEDDVVVNVNVNVDFDVDEKGKQEHVEDSSSAAIHVNVNNENVPNQQEININNNNNNNNNNNRQHKLMNVVNPTNNNSTCSPAAQARKDKSLGGLCENFIAKYDEALRRMCIRSKSKSNANANSNSSKHDLISIDAAAAVLGVERRRIYDIINILESLEMVRRKCKNTYVYQGRSDLSRVMAELQARAILIFSEDALRNGLVDPTELMQLKQEYAEKEKQKGAAVSKEKSLGKLSQRFIQYFLVGNTNVSLTQASPRVLGTSVGLKTKIRRLYDIANVMVSIGVLQKALLSEGPNGVNRPVFAWSGVCVRQLRCSFRNVSALGSVPPQPPQPQPQPVGSSSFAASFLVSPEGAGSSNRRNHDASRMANHHHGLPHHNSRNPTASVVSLNNMPSSAGSRSSTSSSSSSTHTNTNGTSSNHHTGNNGAANRMHYPHHSATSHHHVPHHVPSPYYNQHPAHAHAHAHMQHHHHHHPAPTYAYAGPPASVSSHPHHHVVHPSYHYHPNNAAANNNNNNNNNTTPGPCSNVGTVLTEVTPLALAMTKNVSSPPRVAEL